MKIFVCIKQVPDTETKIKLLGDSTGIDPASIKWIVNPYDEYAIEEAIRLKESHPGSTVTVFSIGPKKRIGDSLRTALAMGADDGVVVDAPEVLEPLTTAKILAKAIQQEGSFDLLLCGSSAIDDNASSVGPMLAQLLGVPHSSVVTKLTTNGTMVTVEREVEGGTREIIEMQLPALVTATKGLNSPRYASLPGIMKAKKKVLKELDASILLGAYEPAMRMKNYRLPAERPSAKILSGTTEQQIGELVRLLRDEAKAL